jgi:formylglycine-generating enzyme required for sulfatase activity
VTLLFYIVSLFIHSDKDPEIMKKQFTLFFALMVATMLSANNITVTNISLTGQNTTGDYTMVQFDISWENSWRTSSAPNNWDAAWVFVKYRVPATSGGDGLWKHAWLNNTGHTVPAGSTVDIGLLSPSTVFNITSNPGLGAFIYRDTDGIGMFTKTGVQLRWNYGVNYKTGTTPIGDNDVVDIQVFAIEMVYVPQGSFNLGSGGSESGHFYKYPVLTDTYLVESEGSIIIGQTSGNLWGTSTSGSNTIGPAGTLSLSFPKGYAAFYCMKYEICQQDYVDFLNTLNYSQQTTRTNIAPNSAAGTYLYNSGRHKIKISISGTANTIPAVYATDFPYVACNYLNWADLAAYLDWCSLRPMTELEFEKACRGTIPALPNEFAWGTTSIAAATGINNPGANNETASNPEAKACYGNSGTGGPLRVGSFANSTSTRETSGATYYGILEMSGNTFEHPVTVANSTGRAFTSTHGDGILNTAGNSNTSTWPGTAATGTGFRGCDWSLTLNHDYLRTSGRSFAAFVYSPRSQDQGGRGIRSVPPAYLIGQAYGGGIIFYVDGTGQHGLIAATTNQSTGAQWGCYGTSIPGTSSAIGTGQANTTLIVNGCSTAGIAARLCDDLVLNGYSDWFLPSKDELYQMYLQKTAIGGFTNFSYWSSSEYNATNAWDQAFGSGSQSSYSKNFTGNGVRAVRAF